MERHELIDKLSVTRMRNYATNMARLAEESTLPVDILHDLCYDGGQHSVAFRAAWVLEHVATYHPHLFLPIFQAFMARLPEQRNFSCQRHFTKILMIVTDPRSPQFYRQALRDTDRERLVEIVFGWLIDSNTPVAVQVNCMDILFNMIPEFEWIASELQSQIEFLLRDGSAAMQSRGKKIQKKLKPQIHT